MKKNFLCVAAVAAALTFAACNNGETSTTTDSTTVGETSSNETNSSETNAMGSTNTGSSSVDESASYVDLKSGQNVSVRRDTTSGYFFNRETNQPLLFYYNPVTHDTFDRSGRIVNNFLIRGTDGSYSVDEQRWNVKADSDGDIKAKDHDESKVKLDANGQELKTKTQDTKVKADENSYKKKVDGKVVEKTKTN